jgi:signal transduction histidine kinase
VSKAYVELPSTIPSPQDGQESGEHADLGVSAGSRRLRSLAALSGSLTDPRSAEDAAQLVEQHAMAALGATSAVVVTLAREAAEQANLLKAKLVATISHELRTPINSVIGYVDLLSDELDGPITAQQRHHLTHIRASGMHLSGLVEEILEYTRIEAGQEVVRRVSFLLSDVVEQALILIRPLAERKRLPLSVAGLDAPVTLYTDRRKLCQILTNVLANAVKFTSDGHVILRVRVEGEPPDGRILFEVEDTGDGIAIENQEHVFDAFWRLDPGGRNSAGSTGLGLPVARQLAGLLGGDVVIRSSNVGVGSTFVVTTPVSRLN